MKIDLSEIYQVQEATLNELKKMQRKFARFAEQAAAYERGSHRYQNRTGNLEGSTRGYATRQGDEIEVSLEMGMDYASYVVDRGFSNIDVAEKMLATNIENYLTTIGFNL